jgi:hypothetical protein
VTEVPAPAGPRRVPISAPAPCAHALPVRLVVEGPEIQPVLDGPAGRFGVLYTVHALTPGRRPDELFTWGHDYTEHDHPDCRCAQRSVIVLERALGANLEYLPNGQLYVATWRLVPPFKGHEHGRNLTGTGPTVQSALTNLAVLLRRGKEVVH